MLRRKATKTLKGLYLCPKSDREEGGGRVTLLVEWNVDFSLLFALHFLFAGQLMAVD